MKIKQVFAILWRINKRKHNKVYEFMGNRVPLYRVEKDKIFESEFGTKQIYETKDRPVR